MGRCYKVVMEQHRNKRVAIREPFCPSGCKHPIGSIHRIGAGGCAHCVHFQKESVLQQGKISAQLIATEDAEHLASSQRLIPTLPPSPDGKKISRETIETIASAQAFLVNFVHQSKSGFGASGISSSAPAHHVSNSLEEDSADVDASKKKASSKKKLDPKKLEPKKKQKKDEFSLSEEDDAAPSAIPPPVSSIPPATFSAAALPSLKKALNIGQDIAIQDFGEQGRGLVSKVEILKSQYVCYYDGNRVDAVTGQTYMICKRTKDNIARLPVQIQIQLRGLQYRKMWAVTLNRGTNITKYGGTRNIVIDGTLAASPLLDYLVDRGLIGPGSLMNSSYGTGIPANCILIFVPWPVECYSLANFFVPTESERMIPVLVAKCKIAPNTQLTWEYSIASHSEALPMLMGDAPGVTTAPGVTALPSRSVVMCIDCQGESERCSACQTEDPRPEASELDAMPGASDHVYTPVLPATKMEERIHAAGTLKAAELKALVKSVMDIVPSIVPVEFRIYNVTNKYSIEELRQWCENQAQRMTSARLKRFKTSLSARDSVEACMRMLAIFCNDQYMQTLYLQSRSLPSQAAMDANAFGESHPFWSELHTRFHSTDHVLPFPFDYIPTKIKVVNSQGINSEFQPPKLVEAGFLSGLDLLHGRKPPLYADHFFSKKKLLELWKQSLADYRYVFKPFIRE